MSARLQLSCCRLPSVLGLIYVDIVIIKCILVVCTLNGGVLYGNISKRITRPSYSNY